MEATLALFGALIGLALVGLVIVVPIIALVRAHKAVRLSNKNQENIQSLNLQIHKLQKQVEEMQLQATQQAFLRDMAQGGAPGAVAKPEAPAPAKPPVPAAGPSMPPVVPPRPSAVLGDSHPPLRPTVGPLGAPKPPSPPAIPTGPQAPAFPKAPAPPVTAPQFQTSDAKKPSDHNTAKRVLKIEEVLGTNWLNKLGIILVVMGIASFLVYEMRELGPPGKVMVGYLVSAAMLGVGLFFERRERWQILARASVGGGWALLYFTTYAMNHFEATRVLNSEPLDFLLLIVVAAAMVGHSLRYDSKVITGLAFLLAFSTINISRAGTTGLIASAILAVALVVIVIKRKWYDLEVLAIVALFLNHYFWLRPIIEPMHGHRHPFPEFLPSAVLLIFYWAIFRASYLLRQGVTEAEEKISTVGALLNSFLFLGVMKYQAVHPQWAFYALLVIGAVELTLGQLPITRRRRTAFIILSTIGATLIAVAFPFKYSGLRLTILWLGEAEALVLAGIFTREILFRWLGIAAELLMAGHMFLVDTQDIGVMRDARAADFSEPHRAVVFLLGALLIFANVHWIPRRWPGLLKGAFEEKFYRLQSYLAGLLLLAAMWAACPEPWLAVGLAALALIFAFVGARFKIDECSVLANSFALLAFLRIIFADFSVIEVSYVNLKEVIAVAMSAVLLYAASRWIGLPTSRRTYRIPEVYTWVGTTIVSLLAWYQLWPSSVALAWALIGLLLFQLGFERQSPSLRLQSYLLFLASFLRVFFVNFNAETSPGLLSPRLYAALPLAILFYFVYERLEKPEPFLTLDGRLRAAQIHCIMGTLTIAAAMRFELSPDWIAAAWSGLLLCFVLIAWKWGRRIFLGQALLIGLAVFFRTIFHNFYQRSYFPAPSFWWGGWATVGSSVILLFLALLVALKLKLPRPEGASARRGLIRRGLAAINRNPAEIVFIVFFILLTGLLFVELRTYGMTTVAWGVESVAVFLFSLAVKERSFRWSALALLLVCVVKIVAVDVWGLAPRDRYLTFIGLGIALLTVSFLYTRFKEALRAYL